MYFRFHPLDVESIANCVRSTKKHRLNRKYLFTAYLFIMIAVLYYIILFFSPNSPNNRFFFICIFELIRFTLRTALAAVGDLEM